MSGMDRRTGRAIGAEDHLAQSVEDILTTPVGSRVMRRAYGSDLPLLLDAPLNGETIVDVFQAVAEALAAWEPRLTLRRVELVAAEAGRAILRLTAEERTIEVAVGRGAA